MPLTPADVHNVAFSKPPIGKRGYNEDEVDAFLDLVENELQRLIEENADLHQRMSELDQELASARSGGGVQPTQTIPSYQPEPEPVHVPPPAPVYEACLLYTSYPSTLRITIAERIPIVVKDAPDGPHLFDRDGVDFATEPSPGGLPYLDADAPGPSDPPTKAALQVLTALRPEVAGQVSRIAAPSVASITLTLDDGREVIWGTTDRTEEKALKLAALLTQPGRTYDVSSPDLPTVK